jgi:hypothetical protein
MNKTRLLIILVLFLPILALFNCQNNNTNSFKTFVMNEGVIHFSVEYPANYEIDYLHPAEATGNYMDRSAALFLKGPKDINGNSKTNLSVGASPPDSYASDAKSLSERVETNAASWKDYKLLYKGEITIDGIQAYRLDFQVIDIVPAIAGNDEPGLELDRYVQFDANGYIWTIYIQSHTPTAETDKEIFEHVLATLKILD